MYHGIQIDLQHGRVGESYTVAGWGKSVVATDAKYAFTMKYIPDQHAVAIYTEQELGTYTEMCIRDRCRYLRGRYDPFLGNGKISSEVNGRRSALYYESSTGRGFPVVRHRI